MTGTGAAAFHSKGNRESVWRLFHRDGVVRYLARTWRARRRRYEDLAGEAALAHVRVHRLRSRAKVHAVVRALPAPFTPSELP